MYRLLTQVEKIPSIKLSGTSKFEIHSLTSHSHVFFFLWSITSFILKSNLDPFLIVHDDGTLTDIDKDLLTVHLYGVTIISASQSLAEILPTLKQYPASYKYRSTQPFAKKVFDVFHYAKTQKLFILDSDVLFLSTPQEIVDWAIKDNQSIKYNWDPFDTEEAIHQLFRNSLKQDYVIGYNSGMQCTFKNVFNNALVERYLKYFYDNNMVDWVTEQRCMSLMTFVNNGHKYEKLPRDKYFFQNKRSVFYKNRNLISFPNNIIAKHYSRYARSLFYTEGIPYLLRN